MSPRVVVASGCFGPLHRAHIEYLQRSKDLGDKLIVIVNNDRQAALRKGLQPHLAARERVKLVRSLACVDAAIESIDKDHSICETLRLIHPDVLTKGGDQIDERIPEAQVCAELGIRVVVGLGDKIQSPLLTEAERGETVREFCTGFARQDSDASTEAPSEEGNATPSHCSPPEADAVSPAAATCMRYDNRDLYSDASSEANAVIAAVLACEREDAKDACAASEASTEASGDFSLPEETLEPLRPLPVQRRTQLPPLRVPSAPGLRLAVVLNGTCGDLFPLLALSRHLQTLRHEIRFFTNVNLIAVCAEHGIRAEPVFCDTQDIIHRLGGLMPDAVDSMRAGGTAAKAWYQEHPDTCRNADQALDEYSPQAVIVGNQSMTVALSYEARATVPAVPVYLSHMAFRLFKHCARLSPRRPAFFPVSSPLQHKAVDVLPGLKRTPEWVLYDVPGEADLSPGGKLAGLRRFLGNGPAPVALGWGSMLPRGMSAVEMLALALRSLKLAGKRGVILGGYARLEEIGQQLLDGKLDTVDEDFPELREFALKDVFFVPSAPHEWLFPQCCAVVHHGGAGTLQTAIRAGVPSVVTPIFSDQFEHSACTSRHRVGFGFDRSLQLITAQEIAEALLKVELRTEEVAAAGRRARDNCGERDAAVTLDSFLRSEVLSGQWATKARPVRHAAASKA